MDHTQPKKTIQDVAQPYRTKEDNKAIQQYNPRTLQDCTIPYSIMKDEIGLHRTIQDCAGEKGLQQITSYMPDDLR